MLFSLAVVLIVLWLFGIISSYTLGGWIHLLLLAAILALILRLTAGPPRPPGPPPF